MIGQTEVGLLSGKGPLIATFGYEKSDTRLYHFYRSNMEPHYKFDTICTPLHVNHLTSAPPRITHLTSFAFACFISIIFQAQIIINFNNC